MKKILYLSLAVLFLNCKNNQEKNIDDLENLPVLPNEILIVVDENSFQEFPTIVKFSSDQIVISRFQDSNNFENDTIKILSKSFIEDGDSQITIFKTNKTIIKLSGNSKNENIYYAEGIDLRKKITLIGISNILLEQIVNLKNK